MKLCVTVNSIAKLNEPLENLSIFVIFIRCICSNINHNKHINILFLQNWTKCAVNVKIASDNPSYLEFAFYHINDLERRHAMHAVHIDVGTLKMNALASRTKYNTYGLFWQRNDQHCKLFFAFESPEKLNLYVKYLDLLKRLLRLDRSGMHSIQHSYCLCFHNTWRADDKRLYVHISYFGTFY